MPLREWQKVPALPRSRVASSPTWKKILARSSKNFETGSTTPGGSFDVDRKRLDLEELRGQASDPDLWSNPEAAKQVTRTIARYESTIDLVDGIASDLDDAQTLLDLAKEEGASELLAEATQLLTPVSTSLSTLERETLFFAEYDDSTALMSIHAGAGGVDAQDWAEMLLRMYTRYFDQTGFDYRIEEIQPGDEAGIKSASLTVEGDYAYGSLVGEKGVHRLVRISPFDSNARRHTSFAGVDVVPEVEEDLFEISPDDLRIETFRAQGAGGQHVNTTDSAVRITHVPTNTVVACQAERSQLQNRNRAMIMLQARLAELARKQHAERIDEIRGEQGEAAWGNQIRSYVLQPYQMVKDLRTDFETSNVQAVLDGDLSSLTDSFLGWRRRESKD